jgi:hypothetical protein
MKIAWITNLREYFCGRVDTSGEEPDRPPTITAKFYLGGCFIPGGGRAVAGGGWYKVDGTQVRAAAHIRRLEEDAALEEARGKGYNSYAEMLREEDALEKGYDSYADMQCKMELFQAHRVPIPERWGPPVRGVKRPKSARKLGIVGVFLIFLVGAGAVSGVAADSNKILLKDVDAIILKPGEMTTARRVSPVAQLACQGGLGCRGKYALDSVVCKNIGWDGKDVVWECEAELPNEAKFGYVEVSCEGYDYPEDPYVLVGSCQLRYNLKGKANTPTTYKSETSTGYGSLIIGCALILALLQQCGGGNTRSHQDGPGFWGGVATGAAVATAFGGGRRRNYWGGPIRRTTSTWGSRRGSGGTYRAKKAARTSRR